MDNQINNFPNEKNLVVNQTINSTNQPRHLYLITITCFVVLIICIGAILYLKLPQQTDNPNKAAFSPALTQTTTVEGIIDLNDVPALYPKFQWNTVSNRIKKKDTLFLDVYPSHTPEIIGKEWTTTLIAEQQDLKSAGISFFNYYEGELRKKGWNNTLTVKNVHFDAITADGPLESALGLLISDGDSIREIVLQFQKERLDNCPCNIHFSVFISDITKINTILSQY